MPWPEEISLVRYRLTNRSGVPIEPALFLSVRPFQVNPPSQFLNATGGVAAVRNLMWSGRTLEVGTSRVVPLRAPTEAGATAFDAGDVAVLLERGTIPNVAAVSDPSSSGSGVLRFDDVIAAGGSQEVWVQLLPSARPVPMPKHDGHAEAPAHLAALAAEWHERLSRVGITVPAAGREHLDTLRANEAYMLINRDGPALQPGARSYAALVDPRRGDDGGGAAPARPRGRGARRSPAGSRRHQYPDGKVPCCVDARGADPVPENDADGELIFLVAETTRLTGDTRVRRRAVAARRGRRRPPRRAARRSAAPRRTATPDKLVFFGLMPESISHEGYSAKPMHSYWDDFWALRGYADAAALAAELGRPDEAARIGASRDEFRADLVASIARAMAAHGIDYVPGCAELGDFDATSTTVALAPTAADAHLPRAAARADVRAVLGELRRPPRRRASRGRTTRRTSCAPSAPSSASAGATAPTSCSTTSSPTACPPGWRQWAGDRLARPRRPRASSATCRTPGSAPTTSARSSTCSPSSGSATGRSSSPPACPPPGSATAASGCATCAPAGGS